MLYFISKCDILYCIGFNLSVEEAEEPERYFVAEAEYDVGGGYETVGDVEDLGESLSYGLVTHGRV